MSHGLRCLLLRRSLSIASSHVALLLAFYLLVLSLFGPSLSHVDCLMAIRTAWLVTGMLRTRKSVISVMVGTLGTHNLSLLLPLLQI